MRIFAPLLLILTLSSTSTVTAVALKPAEHSSGDSSKNKGQTKNNKPDETKYFHEPGGDNEMGHYDARFFRGKVPYEQHRPALQHLIRSYLMTFHELGIETWLAHGSLLGWWWNGHIMPWDYDLDVQVTVETLRYLGQHLNRTTYEYTFPAADADPDIPIPGQKQDETTATAAAITTDNTNTNKKKKQEEKKTYLLDVNPHHGDAGRGNGANVIDARWIDTGSGLFVDITGLAERDPAGAPGVWSCKNAHRYRTAELYPLRRAAFEGAPARVPYAFGRVLADEYGARSLVATEWAGHRWVPGLKEWVKIPKPAPEEDDGDDAEDGKNVVVVVVEETVVKEV